MFSYSRWHQSLVDTTPHTVFESTAQRDGRSLSHKCASLAAVLLLTSGTVATFGQTTHTEKFRFLNVADSSQGFSTFTQFPAINNDGAVAFEATGPAFEAPGGTFGDGVFKWRDGVLTPLATTASGLSLFGIDPVINDLGVVAYEANLNALTRVILTSDGVSTKTIFNSTNQGVIGRFLGSPSINRSGTIAFSVFRDDFSQAILRGDGDPPTVVADTVNSNFTAFQNAAINDFGKVTFVADSTDGSTGLFTISTRTRRADGSADAPHDLVDIVDTNNPDFAGFGDPVINRFDTVADDAFRSDNSVEILSGNRRGITARTDIVNPAFTQFEHPSINDSNAVAFFGITNNNTQGVFLEMTGGASPIPVIQTGDTLFDSTVTGVDLGRFALNDRFQLAFEYTLSNGRTGIAIASLRSAEDGEGR